MNTETEAAAAVAAPAKQRKRAVKDFASDFGEIAESNAAKRKRPAKAKPAPKAAPKRTAAPKLDQLLKLLKRPQGATPKEMQAALGWSSPPARAHRDAAARAGMRVESFDREDGKRAWRAVA